jgi:hypothetical protein
MTEIWEVLKTVFLVLFGVLLFGNFFYQIVVIPHLAVYSSKKSLIVTLVILSFFTLLFLTCAFAIAESLTGDGSSAYPIWVKGFGVLFFLGSAAFQIRTGYSLFRILRYGIETPISNFKSQKTFHYIYRRFSSAEDRRIHYSYTVGGTTYHATKIICATAKELKQLTSVLYDPKVPSRNTPFTGPK